LKEYLESMAGRDRREVKQRLTVLLMHLLKWEHQATLRSRSWRVTIQDQQDELRDDVAAGSLRRHALEVLPEAYRRGVRKAAGETGLPEEIFPSDCP
jgi:hypothetical protein